MLLIAVGVLTAWQKWIDEAFAKKLAAFVVNITLPALIITNFLSSFGRDGIMHAWTGFLAAAVSIGITYCIAVPVSMLLRIEHNRRGAFRAMFTFSNAIFLGIPVNVGLFGEASIPFVSIYYITNTLFFWSIGAYGIRRDRGDREPFFTLSTLGKICSPPVIAFALSLVLIFLDVTIPKALNDTLKYLGAMTTPLSMVFVGAILFSAGIDAVRPTRALFGVMAGRFIIAPVIMIGILMLLPQGALGNKVFFVEASLPVLIQTAIAAGKYEADYKYVASIVSVTTVISIICIPVLAIITGKLF